MIKEIKLIEEQFENDYTAMKLVFSEFIKKYLLFEEQSKERTNELDERERRIKVFEDKNLKTEANNQTFYSKLSNKEQSLKRFEAELNNTKERLNTRDEMLNALESQNAVKQQTLERKELDLKERADGISIREAELIVKERKLEEAKKMFNFQSL